MDKTVLTGVTMEHIVVKTVVTGVTMEHLVVKTVLTGVTMEHVMAKTVLTGLITDSLMRSRQVNDVTPGNLRSFDVQQSIYNINTLTFLW